ncbi:MAG: serine/threonine-protein kinase [Ferruginibacter sp.]
MAKVFTITEGLENLGALKTGGQGSVYKGKRMGEIFSAIKILPTPIYSENEEDKNYTSFMNEVAKLKKVNEIPNPNIVRILNAGITETGNLPFIEMEYIEGPDLSELLSPPNDPVFTLKEIIKVCDHLSNALAHCHRAGIRHGDIKTNNVKFNSHTGNYMLLDFGLSVMTDEQRRTSFRHAGAIEFMAPEQNDGVMLFQTDVYSFGIIIYELLAGQVPFPLKDNGETARNAVMVAHMEKGVPDPSYLRKNNLPESWPPNRQQTELNVPYWLMNMLDTCLQKSPANRFNDGIALQNYIAQHSMAAGQASPATVSSSPSSNAGVIPQADLQKKLQDKERQVKALEEELEQKSEYIQRTTSDYYNNLRGKNKVSKSGFITLLFITLALLAYIGYSMMQDKNSFIHSILSDENTSILPADTAQVIVQNEIPKPKPIPKQEEVIVTPPEVNDSTDYRMPEKNGGDDVSADPVYRVSTIAHFYDRPEDNSRRNTFITYKDNFRIKVLDESGAFIYTELETVSGILLKGWLKKDDLIKSKA